MGVTNDNERFGKIVADSLEQGEIEQPVPEAVVNSIFDVLQLPAAEVPDETVAELQAILLGYAHEVRQEFKRTIDSSLLMEDAVETGTETVLSAPPEQMASMADDPAGVEAFRRARMTGELDADVIDRGIADQ